MLIGVPKEIKDNEFRVGMTPAVVAELLHHGHTVLVEASAGLGSGLTDDEYRAAGATIVSTAAEIFERAEMIVKVKEPQEAERKMLRSGQVLFTYLHLAPDLPQTEDLIKSDAVCIAYETVTSAERRFAVARADVGGRGTSGAAGRRACAGEGRGRPWHLAGRRSRRARGRRADYRRRRLRHPCRDHRARHGRACHDPRPFTGGIAPAFRSFRGQSPDDLLDPRGDPRMGEEGRSDHRCRARSRCIGAEAHHARNARHHETRRRARRYRDRPGRLCRDLEADDAL